jgi:hypothetical protein
MARRGATLGGIHNGPVSRGAVAQISLFSSCSAATRAPNNLHQTVAFNRFYPAG